MFFYVNTGKYIFFLERGEKKLNFDLKFDKMGNLESKFANVPAGKETKILFQQEGTLGNYDVLFEIWSWDGIMANSFVFLNEDIAGLADEDLKALVKNYPLWEGKNDLKVTRASSGFTFVTFNVETSDTVDYLNFGSDPDPDSDSKD